MSRISKGSSGGAPGADFQQVLAEVGRSSGRHAASIEEDAEASSFPGHPLAGAVFSFDPGRRASSGGGSHWDAALAWVEDREEPIPPAAPPRVIGDTPESVLEELGPIEDLSVEALNRLRRLYMWRNHPDRRSETQRESATKRVAIANMLLDRAQSRLAGRRKG